MVTTMVTLMLAMVSECRNMLLLTAVQNALENGEFEKFRQETINVTVHVSLSPRNNMCANHLQHNNYICISYLIRFGHLSFVVFLCHVASFISLSRFWRFFSQA